MVEKLWRYVKPFSYNTSVSRTDGQTDRQTDGRTDGRTELLYEYRASAAICWRAIKTWCQRNDMFIIVAIEVYFYIVLHLLCTLEGLKLLWHTFFSEVGKAVARLLVWGFFPYLPFLPLLSLSLLSLLSLPLHPLIQLEVWGVLWSPQAGSGRS